MSSSLSGADMPSQQMTPGLETAQTEQFPFSASRDRPNAQVRARLERFRRDLRGLSLTDVTRKHLAMGQSYLLDHDEDYALRSAIADRFQCHPHDVSVVGSAQLGFSIAPGKRYHPFHVKSDIDVAILAESTFDEIWKEARDYQMVDPSRWPDVGMFRKYLMNGWIRPDALPRVDFPRRTEWLESIGAIGAKTKSGSFHLSVGLYRTRDFLEAYQMKAVADCVKELELEI